jgi:hypothetical protein
LSRAVTVSLGALLVPPVHENAFETKGPPAGLDTVEPVNDQPVVVPPSTANVLEAGPDPESETAFWSLNEPAIEPW